MFYSGSLVFAGGGLVANWGTGQAGTTGDTSIVNVLGGSIGLNGSAQEPVNLNQTGNANNTGILNLDGGYVQADSIVGTAGQLNFNGGTLVPSEAASGISSTWPARLFTEMAGCSRTMVRW